MATAVSALSIIRAVSRQLFWLVTLLLILLAVYVSLGQQLIPLVQNYRSDIESRLSQSLGMPVQLAGVRGAWNQLNPVLYLQQVQLMAAVGTESSAPQAAVEIDNIEVELDALASLLGWRLILQTVNINGLAFEFMEQSGGGWQLAGVNTGTASDLTADQVFEIASRFGNLELNETRLNFHFLNGQVQTLNDGRVRFQSRGIQHFLHLDAWWGDALQPLSVSAELQGNELRRLSGNLHLRLPANDYSAIVVGQGGANFNVRNLTGEAELWFSLEIGSLASLQGNIDFPLLGILRTANDSADVSADTRQEEFVQIENLQGKIALQRNSADTSAGWDVVLRDIGFNWQEAQWPEGDMLMKYRENSSIVWQAEELNVGLLHAIIDFAEVMPEPTGNTLQALGLRGHLRNLELIANLAAQENSTIPALTSLHVAANLQEMSMNEYQGAPAIWGVNGYGELNLDDSTDKFSGFLEVSSNDLMLHLPGLFQDPWSYQSVNGRVDYSLDLSQGMHLRLVSGVIHAESEIIKGRAQFAVNVDRKPETPTIATLELLVGALQADVAYKKAYLPMSDRAPASIQSVMNWVDSAVLAGDGSNSGLIYRGSTLRGSAPAEKTLQMFLRVEEGQFAFDPAWPTLDRLSGLVQIDDGVVDVAVANGESLGIRFNATTAAVRRNANGQGSWVTVQGSGNGTAAQGLQYLQHTPVTQGFAGYLSDWEAVGDVDMKLALNIPLFMPNTVPEVNIQLELQDNSLFIPELELQFGDISGRLTYQQDIGLQSEGLNATLFGDKAAVKLRSDGRIAEAPATVVELAGRAEIAELTHWPLNTALSNALLNKAQGTLVYDARFEIPQQSSPNAEQVLSRFSLRSDMQSVNLDFPAPLQKLRGVNLPMTLDIDFLADGARVRSTINNILNADLQLQDGGSVERGLILLGARDESLPVRRFNTNAPGIEMLGELGRIDYGQWSDFFGSVAASGATGGATLSRFVSLGDVQIEELLILGQSIEDLSVQLSSTADSLLLELNSELVAGELGIPHDGSDYMDVHFTHLHLPGDDEDTAPEIETDEPLREDPFVNVDPRTFPRLRVAIDDMRLGEADYGQWRLLLDPISTGVRASDLLINSRGLQLGAEGQEAVFDWHFDGQKHESHLLGQVAAANLGEVLIAFGFAPYLESSEAIFDTDVRWIGSPGFFAASALQGNVDLRIREGRFLQGGAGTGSSALKLISILNFDALVRRLRFSDDLVRSGLAYEEINGSLAFADGTVSIVDRLQIIGPSSLFQFRGSLDLHEETVDGSMYITLPVSDNIPWLSGLAALNNLINWQVAVGVFIFDRLFSQQMEDLTSAQYLLQGPWDTVEPTLNQVFTSGANAGVPTPVSEAAAPLPQSQ